MELYGTRLSPWVMRVLLAARAKGHALELVAPEGGVKGPDYLALNPIGKVPTLVDGDLVLPESQIIAEYLDATLSGPALMPTDPAAAARVRLLARLADFYAAPALVPLFQARENPGAVAGAKAELAVALGHIEHFRKAGDAFAVGDSFTLADAALVPFCFFIEALDGQLGTGALLAARPGLAAWWARVKTHEAAAWALAEQAAELRARFAAA